MSGSRPRPLTQNKFCKECGGLGGYQMLNRPEPGFWRKCSRCNGTGREPVAQGGEVGVVKRFCCWIGWHSYFVGYTATGFDGCSDHARCKWCGFEGLVDSQGGLF